MFRGNKVSTTSLETEERQFILTIVKNAQMSLIANLDHKVMPLN